MPELTETAAAEAVRDWALAELDDLAKGYAHPVTIKGQLPDAVATVQRSRLVPADPEWFPQVRIEQSWLFVVEVELSLMVGIENPEPDPDAVDPAAAIDAPAAAAQQQLEGWLPVLRSSLTGDAQLGGELTDAQLASPRFEADLTEPFVEYADGTRGRTVYCRLALAELVDAPD